MSTYAITGIKTGGVSPRVEVDTWYPPNNQTQQYQVTLFVMALQSFMQMDPNDKLSYFQVAGIHGLPYQPWDEETDPAAPNEGYCCHDSLLFATWHRPYMLLYEQRLWEIMTTEIIPQFPADVQGDLTAAASTWRIPYWDWAKKKGTPPNLQYDVPEITKNPQISILSTADAVTQVQVTNPMYKFTMPGNQAMGGYGVADVQDQTSSGQWCTFPFSKAFSTSRWAPYERESPNVSATWKAGEVDNTKVAADLASDPWYENVDKLQLSDMVLRLFAPGYADTYDKFSTTKWPGSPESLNNKGPPAEWLSLEGIHNNIHNWTGGFDGFMGHMAEVPVAAFDPIFWMHHGNIDRLLAIWQTVYPDQWFDQPSQQLGDDGNWFQAKDAMDTPQTGLAPFHKDTNGTKFTSDDVRIWTNFGYTYDTLSPTNVADTDSLRQSIQQLYGSPAEPAGTKEDYIINIRYRRFALGGVPYTIYFFLGDGIPKSYAGNLHQHESLIGSFFNFSNPVLSDPTTSGCGNCRAKAGKDAFATAQIPIAHAVRAHKERNKGPGSLEKADVENYLKDKLTWKVKTNGGRVVELPEDNPFVEVRVHAGKVTHREGNIPTFEFELEPLELATKGKLGGYQKAT